MASAGGAFMAHPSFQAPGLAAPSACPVPRRRPFGGMKEPGIDREYRRLDFAETCLGNAHLDHPGFVRPEREPGKLYRSVGSWFEHELIPPSKRHYHFKTDRSFTWPYGEGITKVYPGANEDRYALGPMVVAHSFPHLPSMSRIPHYGRYGPPDGEGGFKAKTPTSVPLVAPPSALTSADQPYMKMSSYALPRVRSVRRRHEWLVWNQGGDPDDMAEAANDMAKMSLATIFCAKRGPGAATVTAPIGLSTATHAPAVLAPTPTTPTGLNVLAHTS